MLLVIDSTISDNSRTKELGNYLLKNYKDNYKIIRLEDLGLKPLNNSLLNDRYKGFNLNKGKYIDDLLKASKILILAPFYDLSFPSLLKLYIENICINGITFKYNEHGIPESLLHILSLTYITTSGGYINNEVYSYGYIKDVFKSFFNVNKFNYIKAEGLDIIGNNVNDILNKAKEEIDKLEL